MSTRDRSPSDARAAGHVGELTRCAATPTPEGRTGEFAYSSDLWAEGMLWGVTVRSPHPHARIAASTSVRPCGLPGVARRADRRRRARPPHVRPRARRPAGAGVRRRALRGRAGRGRRRRPPRDGAARGGRGHRRRLRGARAGHRRRGRHGRTAIHPDGNVVRHLVIRHGDADAAADVVVVGGTYEVGMQDQAFLGPESGLAIPAEDGGVELLRRDPVAARRPRPGGGVAGLPPEQVRLHLAGVGGAFGAREDVSIADPRLPARAAHRPAGEDGLRPRRVVLRPRAPPSGAAALRARREPRRRRWCTSRRRRAARRRCLHVVVAGGGRATPPASPPARTACPTPRSTRCAVRTNNPPCGAMRGFGAVQVLRPRGADGPAGRGARPRPGRAAAAQRAADRRPAAHRPGHRRPGCRCASCSSGCAPCRSRRTTGRARSTCASCPAASPTPPTARTWPRRGLRDRLQERRVLRGLRRLLDGPRARVAGAASRWSRCTAAAEVGQGLVTLLEQIARTELGVDGSSSCPPTRRSARPGRPRPRGRPG